MTLTLSLLFAGGSLVALFVVVYRLRHSEERFRLLAENASDLVVLHSPDGRWVWASPSVHRILGYTPAEMIGRDAYELFHPDDQERIRESSHEPVLEEKDGAGIRTTYRIQHREGHYIWLETLTQPILKNGEVVQLLTSSREVTARKEAEYLYRYLIRNLPQTSVLLFDSSFRHLVAEGPLLGNTLVPEGKNLEGRKLWEVFPEDVAATLAPLYSKTLRDQPTRKVQAFRTRLYDAFFLPVHDSTGFVRAGMAVFTDITDKQARLRQVQERTADLERSNRDLEQFAHVASHELKSPLRRIGGFSEILSEEYRGHLSDEADEYLDHIAEGVRSLEEVIDSLLVYSRVQSDRLQLGWVSPEGVLREAVGNLASLIRVKGATVRAEGLPELLTGDEVLIRQLFENLIGNAVKFNTTGRVPEVRVRCFRTLLDWEFHIEDNGPGLSEAYRDKVFTMFQRLHPDVEGTGIGLALCKKIVSLHRGKIWFESKGDGTTFKFTLPARSPEEATDPGR